MRRYELTLFPKDKAKADGEQVSWRHFDDLEDAKAAANADIGYAWEIRDHADNERLIAEAD